MCPLQRLRAVQWANGSPDGLTGSHGAHEGHGGPSQRGPCCPGRTYPPGVARQAVTARTCDRGRGSALRKTCTYSDIARGYRADRPCLRSSDEKGSFLGFIPVPVPQNLILGKPEHA